MLRKKSTLILVLVAGALVLAAHAAKTQSQNPSPANTATPAQAIAVKTQTTEASKTIQRKVGYPASVAYTQETDIISQTSGIASGISFNLGDRVSAGQHLVTIDNATGSLAARDGFKDAAVHQAGIDVEQKHEAWKQAKRDYARDKTKANKTAKDIAELDYQSAQVTLQNLLDARVLKSPITGVITSKNISNGQSVTAGDVLATVSGSTQTKITFFVDQAEISSLRVGLPLEIIQEGQSIPATVTSLSPQADARTGRFQVEAHPQSAASSLKAGTLVTVTFNTVTTAHEDTLLLPLAAVTVNPNQNFVFLNDNGRARKVPVILRRIQGEIVEVSGDFPTESAIIVEGNKLLQEGDVITE
jgi:membrane fusion protein (multidrug efflux system)